MSNLRQLFDPWALPRLAETQVAPAKVAKAAKAEGAEPEQTETLAELAALAGREPDPWEVIRAVRDLGGVFAIEDGQPRVRGVSALPHGLIAQLRTVKPHLVRILTGANGPTPPKPLRMAGGRLFWKFAGSTPRGVEVSAVINRLRAAKAGLAADARTLMLTARQGAVSDSDVAFIAANSGDFIERLHTSSGKQGCESGGASHKP